MSDTGPMVRRFLMLTAVNDWMPNWKRNGWKTATGGDVVNKRDFEDLERTSRGMDVSYVCMQMSVLYC